MGLDNSIFYIEIGRRWGSKIRKGHKSCKYLLQVSRGCVNFFFSAAIHWWTGWLSLCRLEQTSALGIQRPKRFNLLQEVSDVKIPPLLYFCHYDLSLVPCVLCVSCHNMSFTTNTFHSTLNIHFYFLNLSSQLRCCFLKDAFSNWQEENETTVIDIKVIVTSLNFLYDCFIHIHVSH